MYEFQTREQEPIPGPKSIEFVALRRNPDGDVDQLRASLPALVAGIAAEVPGATLELVMITGGDGIVATHLTASAGQATAAVIEEIAAALQPVAETAVASGEGLADGYMEWPVVADSGRRPLGFAAAGSDAPAAGVMCWDDTEDSPVNDLFAVLASLPGHGIRVWLQAIGDAIRPRWQARLTVVTAGEPPALRLRAALRRRFAGLRVGWSPNQAPAQLELDEIGLPRVFAIPVAGSQPLAGTCTAAAALIPVAPTRRDTVDAESGLRIGHAVTLSGQKLPVELTVGERLRHIHVLGRTGTGKSSMLAAVAQQIATTPHGALIADPHGQLCDRILAEAPDEVRDRLWLIRCGDADNPVPLNPLAETDPVQRDIAIGEVCAMFQYLFDKNATGIVGPRFRERVAMALRALAAVHGPRTSLLDVPVALADDAFMDRAVSIGDNQRVSSWWANDKVARRSSDYGEVVSWVNSKFEAFAGTAAMRAILGSGLDAIDFVDAMDSGRIILLDLSKAQLGESATRLLGYLYLGRIWSAALRRKNPQRPFTVIVDEAHTLISGALTSMLAEGRKFGLSVVLAHQYLEQLDADLRPAVDGNVATTVAFRCGVSDAVEVYKRFGGLVDPSVLMTLPDLTAVTLRTASAGPAHPYTVVVDHNSRTTARRGAELADYRGEVLRSTYSALVDPFRELTAAAVVGTSNVTAIPIETDPPVSSASRRPAAGSSRRSGQAAKADSFLQEWLERHEQDAEQESA